MRTKEYGKKGKKLTQEDIDRFRKDYYSDLDFLYWYERIRYIHKRINVVKSPKLKARSLVDIYSVYIQLVEILLIHMNSLKTPPNLFLRSMAITNQEIRDFAQTLKTKNDKFLEVFIGDYIHALKKEFRDEDKVRREVSLLKECINDYRTNYKFLNAFKHGYRVNAAYGNNHLSVGIPGGKMMKILSGDSAVSYYEVSGNSKKGKISNIDMTFNYDRVEGKAMFLIYVLENYRLSMMRALGHKEPVRYTTYDIGDEKTWRDSFGQSSFRSGMFYWPSNADDI